MHAMILVLDSSLKMMTGQGRATGEKSRPVHHLGNKSGFGNGFAPSCTDRACRGVGNTPDFPLTTPLVVLQKDMF
jgi:hypothetical protein